MPKYDLEFKPREKRRMEQIWRFLAGFLAIFLLLGVVSVVVMQQNGMWDEMFGGAEESQTTAPEEESKGWNYTGSAVFLLSETDDNGKALRFAALLRVDIAQRSFSLTMLPPKAKAPMPDGEITLEQAMQRGGVKELKAAVEALTEGKIDRYINSRDAGFALAIDTMGRVAVQSPQRVEHKSQGLELTLSMGVNSLDGSWLLRYFRYLGLQNDGLRLQGELFVTVLETYLVPKYADTPEKMRQRFEKLVNLVETDINSIDFDAQTEMLQALLQSGAITVSIQE